MKNYAPISDVKRLLIYAGLPFLALGISTNALADNYLSCNALVTSVSQSPAGVVNVTFGGMGSPNMCNLNSSTTTSAGTITASGCQALLSTLLTALVSAQSVTLFFDFGSATPPACTAIPNFSWNIPSPYPYDIQIN